MRILTWNINAINSTFGWYPWSQQKVATVEGLCKGLEAEIICLQEHKTRKDSLNVDYACPGPFDAFWTFPRAKSGYSGVCTYVDSRYCVPLKAEEGITGQTLHAPLSVMKPPWSDEERIGGYPQVDQVKHLDEIDGRSFDVKTLDFEGRAIVLDFGLFVLFNLYCPNETNEGRRPYKLNFLNTLEARVANLQSQGREVIVAGDINCMRAPIDSGEGGIKVKDVDHYSNPSRVWFNDWIQPRGPMIDAVREFWPEREGMFTCWDNKTNARPSNYGARIDYILVTPGLRPWLKHGDILPDIQGSDHCPVYVDLHESIEVDGKTLQLRDQLNPADRPPPTFTVRPRFGDVRTAPEPPRFALKHWDEFSGLQKSLKDYFGKKKTTPKEVTTPSASIGVSTQVPAPEVINTALVPSPSLEATMPDGQSLPMSAARTAFDALDTQPPPEQRSRSASTSTTPAAVELNEAIDLTEDSPPKFTPTRRPSSSSQSAQKRPKLSKPSSSSSSSKTGKQRDSGQTSLASFFKKPSVPPPSPPPNLPAAKEPPTSPASIERDALMAQSLVEEETERARAAASKNQTAASAWGQIMARKIPPKCPVHSKPAKDFISSVKGPNKGKRFWVCSVPVGPGYDSGRKSRAREDVNPAYRCDFFMWDEDNHQKMNTGKAVDWVPSKKRRGESQEA